MSNLFHPQHHVNEAGGRREWSEGEIGSTRGLHGGAQKGMRYLFVGTNIECPSSVRVYTPITETHYD